VHAIEPLSQEQLAWRPAPKLRSVGEVALHIATGRVYWFARMPAPGSRELEQALAQLGPEADLAREKDTILHWLEITWQMVSGMLNQWSAADLVRSYRHEYWGKVFEVSYQWTICIWRILTPDVHHGGELALMLGMQGIAVPELVDLFGHLTWPPEVK
jgi:uncharacterized damage-inducible protein DinB